MCIDYCLIFAFRLAYLQIFGGTGGGFIFTVFGGKGGGFISSVIKSFLILFPTKCDFTVWISEILFLIDFT